MTNIINLDEKRVKKKGQTGLKRSSPKRPTSDADARFKLGRF